MKKGIKEKKHTKRQTGLRVVLDTNVYVSVFTHPEGKVLPVWEHALRRSYVLLASPVIVNEVGEVLRSRFSGEVSNIGSTIRLIAKVAEVVVPATIPDVIKDDPDDNHILACAIEGGAHAIVSGDRDLLRLKEYEGVGIVSPTDFLHMLEGYG